jgi:hypothetical protein
MPVIPVNRVVANKRIIGKNGWPRRWRRGKGSLTYSTIVDKIYIKICP